MVDLRSGKSTTPYTKAQEEQVAAVLKERKEKKAKKLIKQAKKLALLEEQGAKKKKLQEEMEKLQREEEEKLKGVEEEEVEEEVEVEVPLVRTVTRERGETSGRKKEDPWMERKIPELVANLSLGEDEEAMLYVSRAEQEAIIQELEAEEDPLKRQTIEEDKKLEWKLR
ncbi:hypothetical protein CBR_g40321 [Chara braunii]|uniref:Uncharacterized protein n=1 Tax=Chara braunii TaxID=69332 RepID=A0A388LTM5_CHABU|nr:hypothetical protein CBR_g40321 [Chara braunii]|eukprot:GBG85593.1 hypothetical protein CBR_g40321 [Chara braunii]